MLNGGSPGGGDEDDEEGDDGDSNDWHARHAKNLDIALSSAIGGDDGLEVDGENKDDEEEDNEKGDDDFEIPHHIDFDTENNSTDNEKGK